MIYLAVFWILAFLFGVLYLYSKLVQSKKFLKWIDEYGSLYFIFLGILSIMAIATRDPVTIAGITIPAEVQWLGSLFVTAFGAWKLYLNPLKSRVIEAEKDIREIRTGIGSMKEDVHLIKQQLLSLVKPRFRVR